MLKQADTINSKAELLTARANYEAAHLETAQLVRQLHAVQLQLYAATNSDTNVDSSTIKEKLVSEK